MNISFAEFRSFPASSIVHNEQQEETAFTFPQEALDCKEGVLHLKFSGVISDKLAGFYRSSYENPQTGQKEFLAVTQFEPTDARRAFPCWDEPALKATFSIELECDASHCALSNMHAIEETALPSQGENAPRKLIRFGRTPIMSTYLIAFVVGPLESLETRNKYGMMSTLTALIHCKRWTWSLFQTLLLEQWKIGDLSLIELSICFMNQQAPPRNHAKISHTLLGMNLLINGLEIWLPWNGELICG